MLTKNKGTLGKVLYQLEKYPPTILSREISDIR